jgi:glutathione S-transferase
MILTGQYDSPFVRRVAVTLQHYGLAYERRVISVYGNFEQTLAVNPLGKVPALELDDGEVLFDSQMILDHLDEVAGPETALTPAAGPARRRVLKRVTVALGVAEKAVALRAELYLRGPGTQDPAWIERLERQIASGLAWLEGETPEPWFEGEAMRQDDVTAAITRTFLVNKLPDLMAGQSVPYLARLAERCETLPAFQAAPFVEA